MRFFKQQPSQQRLTDEQAAAERAVIAAEQLIGRARAAELYGDIAKARELFETAVEQILEASKTAPSSVKATLRETATFALDNAPSD